MSNHYFKFKQFTIQQDQCAMKVCTDACLFGAIVASYKLPITNCLDIGTGTGLLSIMVAQKNTTAYIDAIEIDTKAALQAQQNVVACSWSDRIQVYNENVLTFNSLKKYDCIIANPPFFENDLQSPNNTKNNAKHDNSLTLIQLLQAVDIRLSADGFFALLLPYQRVEFFIEEALNFNLHLSNQILVKQSSRHQFFRGIIFFKRNPEKKNYSIITIKDTETNYSNEFIEQLKDYYLYL